tara:strand:+ start:1814 stop:2095 length:282 start_codon:yes stop_codon:yes gene_type:complete
MRFISKILPVAVICAVERHLKMDKYSLYNKSASEFYEIAKDIPSFRLERYRGVGPKSIARFEDFIYTSKFFEIWENRIKERTDNSELFLETLG